MPSRGEWETVIVKVVTVLDDADIEYHIDASSSLYVQGVDFNMDDLDITVKWGSINESHQVFEHYHPTELDGSYPVSFKFKVDEHEVHVMSYESITGIGDSIDRLQVKINNRSVWTKSIHFYEKNMGPNHPLEKALSHYRQLKNL